MNLLFVSPERCIIKLDMMIATIISAAVLSCLVVYFGIAAIIAGIAARATRAPLPKTPVSLGIVYEDISFHSRADKLLLKGWYLPGTGRGTIIVAHGGKQNRADASMQLLNLCGDLARAGFSVLTFDRRGCGESEAPARRNRSRFERDIGGAVDYVRSRNGALEKVFLLGISIGAVAGFIFTAREKGIGGIISDSCFTSARETARIAVGRVSKALLPFLPGALLLSRMLYGFKPVRTIDCVAAVTCPVLFIHGEADEGVPVADAYRLFEAANKANSELWVVPGARHSQAYRTNPREYVHRVISFLVNKCGAG